MATGGVATLLAAQPHSFTGLHVIGKVVFIFDVVAFLCFTSAISARFLMYPGSFHNAISHPTESLFIPTFFLSIFDIFNGSQAFGVPSTGYWLVYALRVCFWIYLACTFLLATAQYLFLFTGPPKRLTVQSMTPSWLLPIFPAMLSGTFASGIARTQPADAALAIIVAGVTMQGLGWMVSFLMYSAYIQRLMQYGLPAPNMRPGMFIAVGPPSFTSLALIGMSRAIPSQYAYFGAHPDAAEALRHVALWTAVFLWTLGFWFFSISLMATLLDIKKMSFHLVWYALVFPNVGFTIAIIDIGEGFQSPAVQWVGSVLTVLLVATWLFVMIMHLRAVLTKQIMMPGVDEDKDQYGEKQS
ncbi:hypothetical protein LTR62_001330 [Meristemomyces frigidus]|uniref:Malic acid transport protein n=1 Tax=Meristemomyces frigidus TaxID=1508187 RepID=A0AAN7YL47_9PEZI|nr:hypothetical protein LTR62_001330 [Meristemomyces frigidus]